MASTTTRAALPYPALPDTPDVPRDIKALADALDPLLGMPTFTSTTRPAGYEGQEIFETDTGKVMRYSGTTWQPVVVRTWQTYAPAWQNGSGGTNLAIGSGSLEGWFAQVGDRVSYMVRLVRAADTNVGTSYYAFGLPIAPDSYQSSFGNGIIMRGSAAMPVGIVGVGGLSVTLLIPGGSATTFGTRVSNAAPGSWAVGDVITFGGNYRADASVAV